MRDIIIGGKKTWSSYSSMTLDQCSCISQNRIFYCCQEDYTNTTIYIIKESREGKKFKKFLDKNIENESLIEKYILQIALRNIDANVFLSIYHNQEKIGTNKGYLQCQNDMRKVLGIR